jgi:hypothetical protein
MELIPTAALPLKYRFTNVLTPDMVAVPIEAAIKLTVPYDFPPPAKVGDVPVSVKVEELALRVPTVALAVQAVPLKPNVITEVPKFTVFAVVVVNSAAPAIVILKFPELKLPPANDKLLAVNAEPNVQPPEALLKTTFVFVSVTPLVVTVFPVVVAKKRMVLPPNEYMSNFTEGFTQLP